MTYWIAYTVETGAILCVCSSDTAEAPTGIHYTPDEGDAWLSITEAQWDSLRLMDRSTHTASIEGGALTITAI